MLSNSSCEAHVTLFPGLDGECNADWEQVGSGAVASIVYIIAVVWLFLGIAVICDNQFTDALEVCEMLVAKSKHCVNHVTTMDH